MGCGHTDCFQYDHLEGRTFLQTKNALPKLRFRYITQHTSAESTRQPLECHDFGGSFLLIFLVSFHNFSYHFFYIFISFCVSGYTLSVLFRVKLV